MKEFKGTPGPWVVNHSQSVDNYYSYIIEGVETDEDAEMKRKAISAIPQMLEALQECIKIKDLWSADQFDTLSADPDTSKLALLKMQQKIEAALSAALD